MCCISKNECEIYCCRIGIENTTIQEHQIYFLNRQSPATTQKVKGKLPNPLYSWNWLYWANVEDRCSWTAVRFFLLISQLQHKPVSGLKLGSLSQACIKVYQTIKKFCWITAGKIIGTSHKTKLYRPGCRCWGVEIICKLLQIAFDSESQPRIFL